jgi:hypothetical protein
MPTILLTGKQSDGSPGAGGKLTFDIGDVTTSSIAVDYSTSDKLTFKLSSKSGIKLTNDSDLKIGGDAAYDATTGVVSGDGSLEVSIDKSVDAKIQQTFSTSGSQATTAQVTIHF